MSFSTLSIVLYLNSKPACLILDEFALLLFKISVLISPNSRFKANLGTFMGHINLPVCFAMLCINCLLMQGCGAVAGARTQRVEADGVEAQVFQQS